MCEPTTMSGFSSGASYGGLATSAIGMYAAAQGAKSQANLDDTNARLSELAAQQALLQGQHEEQASRMATAALKSRQRVAFAGNGVDLGSDSAVRTLTATDFLGAGDAATAHANAIRAAFGYRGQGLSYRAQGDSRRAISPELAGYSTLIGGGGQVAKSWYTLNKQTTVTPPPAWDMSMTSRGSGD